MKPNPEPYVLKVDASIKTTREEILGRLRHPDGDGMHTRFWRFETPEGEVIAERSGADVVVHRDVCLRLFGESP